MDACSFRKNCGSSEYLLISIAIKVVDTDENKHFEVCPLSIGLERFEERTAELRTLVANVGC